MTYTHLKVEQDSKAKFKKLAENHNLTMLRLFGLWVDTEYKKLTKHGHISSNDLLETKFQSEKEYTRKDSK